MDAQPGEIVECINDKPSSAKHKPPEVKKGQLYRVIALTVTPGSGRPAYDLETCKKPWSRTRFRKIDGNKSEWLETLKQHKPVKIKEDA